MAICLPRAGAGGPLCPTIALWQAVQRQYWPWLGHNMALRALGAVMTWGRGIIKVVLL